MFKKLRRKAKNNVFRTKDFKVIVKEKDDAPIEVVNVFEHIGVVYDAEKVKEHKCLLGFLVITKKPESNNMYTLYVNDEIMDEETAMYFVNYFISFTKIYFADRVSTFSDSTLENSFDRKRLQFLSDEANMMHYKDDEQLKILEKLYDITAMKSYKKRIQNLKIAYHIDNRIQYEHNTYQSRRVFSDIKRDTKRGKKRTTAHA